MKTTCTITIITTVSFLARDADAFLSLLDLVSATSQYAGKQIDPAGHHASRMARFGYVTDSFTKELHAKVKEQDCKI